MCVVRSEAELDWKARYDVALVDNELSTPGCINSDTGVQNTTKCNDFRAARAADIKRRSPSTTTFVYRSGPFGCNSLDDQTADPDTSWFDSIANIHRTLKDTWLVARFGMLNIGQCEFRKEAAQNYWLTQHVFGPENRWIEDTNVDGMFSDSGLIMGFDGDRLNITVGDRNELFNATCVTMKRMAEALQKHNKILTFSLKVSSNSSSNSSDHHSLYSTIHIMWCDVWVWASAL